MTSAAYDLRACLEYLVPGAICDVVGNDYALTVWKDPRPMPSEAQCAAAWTAVQAQRAAAAQAAQTATANQSAIEQQLDAALTANLQAIATIETWQAGPGAGSANLTAAQLSQAVRAAAANQALIFRQLNGVIRLIRRKLDSTS